MFVANPPAGAISQQFATARPTADLLVLETVAVAANILVCIRLLWFIWLLGRRTRVARAMIWICVALSVHTVARALYFAAFWLDTPNRSPLGQWPLWVGFVTFIWLPVYLYDTFQYVAFKDSSLPRFLLRARRAAILAGTILTFFAVLGLIYGFNSTTVRLFGIALLANSAVACIIVYRMRKRDLRLSGQTLYVLFAAAGLTTLCCIAILRVVSGSRPIAMVPYRAAIDLGTVFVVLGTLFVFSRARFADALLRDVIRIYWMSFILLAAWFGQNAIMALPWAQSVTAVAAHQLLSALFLLGCMAVLIRGRDFLYSLVSTRLFDQADYNRLALSMQWNIQDTSEEQAWFNRVVETLSGEAHFAAARVIRIEELPGPPGSVSFVGHEEIFPSVDNPLSTVTIPSTEVLLPIRIHGEVKFALAVARSPLKGELLQIELTFLRRIARQLESGLDALRVAEARRERAQREELLHAQITESELRALRAQIQPHFLFNSLNTIAHLCIAAPEQAESMTTMLANIFRYVLTSTEDALIPLADEINFVDNYLAIEQMRFGERLEIDFDVEPDARSLMVPPLILQPLVENSLRHGLAPKIDGGQIRITASCDRDSLFLVVEDTGIGLKASAAGGSHGTHVGLSNTQKRLQCHYGAEGHFSLTDRPGGGVRASITLPRAKGVAIA